MRPGHVSPRVGYTLMHNCALYLSVCGGPGRRGLHALQGRDSRPRALLEGGPESDAVRTGPVSRSFYQPSSLRPSFSREESLF